MYIEARPFPQQKLGSNHKRKHQHGQSNEAIIIQLHVNLNCKNIANSLNSESQFLAGLEVCVCTSTYVEVILVSSSCTALYIVEMTFSIFSMN